MHQWPSALSHQRRLSSLADVTHRASVIERDANPAPPQSLAVGWGGTGRDIERDTYQGSSIRDTREHMLALGLQTNSISTLNLDKQDKAIRHTFASCWNPPVLEGVSCPLSRLRPGCQKPQWGHCGGGMLWKLPTSSCTPSHATCSHCGGARLHQRGFVPRWRGQLPDSNWGVRSCCCLCSYRYFF